MKKIIFTHANIYDGTLNMVLKENTNIEVTDGVISNIGDFTINLKDTKVIDLNGSYVVPGLINLHAHLPSSGKLSKTKLGDKSKLVNFVSNNPIGRKVGLALVKKAAVTALNSGVTTVRCVGGVSNLDSLLRDKINEGKILGPRLLVSNLAIGVENGHMDKTVAKAVKSKEEAIKMVDTLKSENVDLIKLMITGGVLDGKEPGHPGTLKMSEELVEASCNRAHELGLKVAAHVEGKEGMHIAMKCGVDSIEHGALFDESLAESFKARNGAMVLTLTPAIPFINLPPEQVYGEVAKINSEIIVEGMIKATEMMHKHDIRVGLGTDAGSALVSHYNFVNELLTYVTYCGVTPNFALHTATLVNASIAGIDNITGSIEVNKSADLLIVKNDPLKDLKALKAPQMVVIKGKVIKNPKIKRIKNIDSFIDKLF